MKPREGKKEGAGLHQSIPRVLPHPALAFYWNIKGEVDLQWHIVKPVTLITKALKWVEGGEEEQEEAENCECGGEGADGENEGGKGPGATTEDVKCVGDWEAAAGKVTVQQAIIISEPLLREVGEQDKWKGIVLTEMRRRMLGIHIERGWENQQGLLKHWWILLRSNHWFLNLFILFLVPVWWACVRSGTC